MIAQCFNIVKYFVCWFAEKAGVAPPPTETPAAPTKKLEDLFFMEEPKTSQVTESEYDRNSGRGHKFTFADFRF